MRIENQKEWIEIVFLQYAKENKFMTQGLIDEDNCVEILISFDLGDEGWGCAGDEFFYTRDIKALAEGFSRVFFGACNSFTYSAGYPYRGPSSEPFYTFYLNREHDQILVSLTIHDCLSEYITVTETMGLSRLESIVRELKITARNFPIV